MTKPHLIACVCCGKRWIDISQIGVACPWCESSCVSLGEINKTQLEILTTSGIKDFRQNILVK